MTTTSYLSLGCDKYNEIEESIRKSYPNSCVLWIETVVNDELEARFIAQQQEIENKRGFCNIMQLFHGTNEQALNSIVWNGFDTTLNKTSAYGKGTYFAKNAIYSQNYSKANKDSISFLLVCDVLIGEYCRGAGPNLLDTNKYDNTVDNIDNPTIYVTPYDNGAIPRYIVAFYKNAK